MYSIDQRFPMQCGRLQVKVMEGFLESGNVMLQSEYGSAAESHIFTAHATLRLLPHTIVAIMRLLKS